MSDTPERNRNQPKGLFYGWIVVLACFFCCFSYAIFYTLGVFFTPIRQEFGWGYALTSSIQTLHLLVFVLSTFIAGLITDRFGPRLPILLGSVCMGVGFLSLGQTQTIGEFYLFYGIASLGSGVCWSIPVSVVQRWFVARHGLALGIVVAGVGVGVLIYAPLANYLISIFGWRTAYIQIGLGTALLLVLSALFATTPERKGLKPYGFEELKGGTLVTPANLGIGQAIKARAFWLVTLVYFLFHVNVFMVNVHLVPFAELAGMGKAGASAAWGLVGGVSIIGKVGVPALAERTVGWRRGIIIECCLLTASLIWLVQVENWWMLSVFVIVYGLSYGGTASLIPAFIHYLFGTTSLGQIIGIAHAVSLMGGALGPLVAGYVIDQTGRYSIAFVIAAAASLLAAVSTLIVKPPRK